MREVLLLADDLMDAASGLADPLSGVVRVGAIPTVAPYLLPEVAPTLRASLPGLEVRWVEDKTASLVSQLARGELDAAIVALEAELGEVEHAVLGVDPFVFAASPDHPLARRRGKVRIEELDDEPVLLLDDGHCFRDQALAACGATAIREASYRATSLQTLVQMTAQGHAVTLLPSLAVPLENRRGDLKVRSIGPRAPYRTLALVWRKGSSRRATFEAVAKVVVGAFPRVVEGARGELGGR